MARAVSGDAVRMLLWYTSWPSRRSLRRAPRQTGGAQVCERIGGGAVSSRGLSQGKNAPGQAPGTEWPRERHRQRHRQAAAAAQHTQGLPARPRPATRALHNAPDLEGAVLPGCRQQVVQRVTESHGQHRACMAFQPVCVWGGGGGGRRGGGQRQPVRGRHHSARCKEGASAGKPAVPRRGCRGMGAVVGQAAEGPPYSATQRASVAVEAAYQLQPQAHP